ncbi:Ctr copper transporter [Exophiala viscosa]|nr:Ctr copper transporter [Exophiala viscosa]
MLFTWSSENLCIVFRQWRVTSTFSLILSLLAIVLLTAGYECVREISRRYEQKHSAEMAAYSTSGSRRDSRAAAERKGTIIKALLYAVQVFYSFFIMLLFMTYNGWVMLAVAVGAFVGYILFGQGLTSTKSVACH